MAKKTHKTRSVTYSIAPSLCSEVKRKGIDLSEKHGKHITASMIVERAIQQFLSLKD